MRIKKVNGAKPDVKFTLSDAICAPLSGLSESDKLEMIRNSSTAKQIPKVRISVEGLHILFYLFPSSRVVYYTFFCPEK